MNKSKKYIIGIVASLMLLFLPVITKGFMDVGSIQEYLYRISNALIPISTDMTWGGASNRHDAYFEDVDANTLSISGISEGALQVDEIIENTTGSGVLVENVLHKDGTVTMSGNLILLNNYISNDGGNEGIRIDNSGDMYTGSASLATAKLDIRQTADDRGIIINGYGDVSAYTYHLYIDSSGDTQLSSSGGSINITNNGFVPALVTADPCGSGFPEGSIFYNDTANVMCYCNGTDDLKIADDSACF